MSARFTLVSEQDAPLLADDETKHEVEACSDEGRREDEAADLAAEPPSAGSARDGKCRLTWTMKAVRLDW